MVTAEFRASNGQLIPVIITGGRKHGLIEVLAIKHRPFTEYSAGGQPGTHAVKRGYVRKSDLVNLRSTRIEGLGDMSISFHDLTLSDHKEEQVKWERIGKE